MSTPAPAQPADPASTVPAETPREVTVSDWFQMHSAHSSSTGTVPDQGEQAPAPADTPTVVTSQVHTVDAGPAASVGDEDLDLLAPPRQRLPRLTVALASGIVLAGVFAGGVLVQRHHDAGLASGSSMGMPSGISGAPSGGEGFPSGGFPGGTAAGAGTGTGAGSSSSAGTPVVVGTLTSVSGTDLLVKNFAGSTVTVHAASAAVTAPGLSGPKSGEHVVVYGTTKSDGSIAATAVTARS